MSLKHFFSFIFLFILVNCEGIQDANIKTEPPAPHLFHTMDDVLVHMNENLDGFGGYQLNDDAPLLSWSPQPHKKENRLLMPLRFLMCSRPCIPNW